MESIRVPLKNNGYEVRVGKGLNGLREAVAGRKVFTVTDSNTVELCLPALEAEIGRQPGYTFPAGESSKNMDTLGALLSAMMNAGLDRGSLLLALGGGVTGDIAGFAAAIYMRGISYIQLPTTLLAQVDSSVGGKTGIDLASFKNIVGAFHQPEAVFANTDFLTTLPPKELLCGWGECVKTAFLSEQVYRILFTGKPDAEKVVTACVRFKAEVVAKDEREGGLRKILNFGHTIGHALETLGMGGELSHGQYVLAGMRLELEFARTLGLVAETYYRDSVRLLERWTPKISMPAAEDVLQAMEKDKKNREGGISFLFPVAPGKVEERLLTRAQAEEIWKKTVC